MRLRRRHDSRLAESHQRRIDLLRQAPPVFLSDRAEHSILLTVERDPQLRLDVEHYRDDAVTALWFARAIEYAEQTVYKQPRLPLIGRQVVPVQAGIPEWARSYRWREMAEFGQAIVVDEQTTASIPMVSVGMTEAYRVIKMYGVAWGWSAEDIEEAARQGTPLSTELMALARNVMDQQIDKTLLLGDSNTGAVGFLKLAEVALETPTTKTGGGTAWSATATGLEIVEDLKRGAHAAQLAEGTTGRQFHVLMDQAHAQILDRQMTGAGMTVTDSGMTIRRYLMQNYGHLIASIVVCHRCTTAGVGGVHRIMWVPAFSSEAEATQYVFGLLNRPFTPYPGVWTDFNLAFKQAGVAKCGGVGVRNGSILRYMDGT